MNYTITIECDNAAFGETEDELKAEIARILRHIVNGGLHLTEPNRLYDANGNHVGTAGLEVPDDLDDWLAERGDDDEF